MGRNYHDYEVYMEQHPDTAVVQMDSVIGSKGGKVLLTIYFVNVSLMLGFLREANTSKSVIDIYDELYHRLGGQDFRKLFPVILTDNGSEFSNPKCIENGPDGKGFQRTRIYYCNPSAPYQKAEIEVGHEFIRRILPKGRSFDELTQADVELMMNHINSYRRKKLNGKSPYEAFSFYYGEDLAERLRCHEVAAKDINLTARLLKK
ncbi:MAG: transposase [Waltera sp.]